MRVEVYFKEVTQNALALVDSKVVFSTVNIGNGRQAAIDEALIARLDREEYYLPNWVTPNKYVFVEHYTLENYYRYNHHLADFFCIEKAEPELLLEAMADFAIKCNSLERSQFVLHNGKIYSRSLEHNEVLITDEEIYAYAQRYVYKNSSGIIDAKGNVYSLYKDKVDDLNNIRVLTKDWRRKEKTVPISQYNSENYTYREYMALDGQEICEELPITHVEEYGGRQCSYINGFRQETPYHEVIELKIISPRILGEELPQFENGDYIQHMNTLEYGVITESERKNNGIYKYQLEKDYEYNDERNRHFNTTHVSLLKKVNKPLQENLGEIAIYVRSDCYGKPECVCIGEIIQSLHEYYIIKIPSFSQSTGDSKNTVPYLYKAVAKTNCYFLKKEYRQYYEDFRMQSEQMEWIKTHAILGTYLYPLLQNMNRTVLRTTGEQFWMQFEPFIMFMKFRLSKITPEQIHNDIIAHIGTSYDYLNGISLKGMYDIPVILGEYFTKSLSKE